MQQEHNRPRWENQPADGWTVNDLDATEIRRTARKAVKTGRLLTPTDSNPEDILREMGLLQDGKPLRASVVLFGQKEKIAASPEWIQCLIQVARLHGTSDTADITNNRQFRGNAFNLLRRAEKFLNENFPIADLTRAESSARNDEPHYLRAALRAARREALANALCHRDYAIGAGSVKIGVYDDRLEIRSTGFLFLPTGLKHYKSLPHRDSQLRNPLIAQAFHIRGITEKRGAGIAKMAELAKAAGLPEPEIEESAGTVAVKFPRQPGCHPPL